MFFTFDNCAVQNKTFKSTTDPKKGGSRHRENIVNCICFQVNTAMDKKYLKIQG